MIARRRRRRRALRAQPLIHQVPNMFTVMSICFGLTAIRYGLDGRYELAVLLIILAGVFDGLDGRSARLLKISSPLGAQLDSLADFLSFGVAPAFLIYLWSLNQVNAVGWALVLLFAICSALRLARFNSELDAPSQPPWMTRLFFTGMPAPAAAGVVLIPMMITFATAQAWPQLWLVNAVVMVGVALLMVSRVPTFSVKTVMIRVKPEWALPLLICVGVLVAALVHAPWLTLLVVGFIYVASLPLGVWIAGKLKRRHARELALAATAAGAPGEASGAPDEASGEGAAEEPAGAPGASAAAPPAAEEEPPLQDSESGGRLVSFTGRPERKD